jgi:hypothetical protein
MKRQPATSRDGRGVKAPAPTPNRAAPYDWQHFWNGEATPLDEDRTRAAQLLNAQDNARRAKGTTSSAAARAAKNVARNMLIRKLRAEGKRADQIRKNADVIKLNGDKPLSISSINRVLA